MVAVKASDKGNTAFLAHVARVEAGPVAEVNTMAKPALINTFIRAGSPKEMNIDGTMRSALVAAPNQRARPQGDLRRRQAWHRRK